MKAAQLRTSFVLASLTQYGRLKWRDKTEADGKLNRKLPYQLTAVNTDTVGKRREAGWQVWPSEHIVNASEIQSEGSV